MLHYYSAPEIQQTVEVSEGDCHSSWLVSRAGWNKHVRECEGMWWVGRSVLVCGGNGMGEMSVA